MGRLGDLCVVIIRQRALTPTNLCHNWEWQGGEDDDDGVAKERPFLLHLGSDYIPMLFVVGNDKTTTNYPVFASGWAFITMG